MSKPFYLSERLDEASILATKLGMIFWYDMLNANVYVLTDKGSHRELVRGDLQHIEQFITRCFKMKAFL